jgi:hypothetical protein
MLMFFPCLIQHEYKQQANTGVNKVQNTFNTAKWFKHINTVYKDTVYAWLDF